MRDLHIIMPMAGLGKRFLDHGYPTAKPLIKYNGKHFFEWALESLNSINAHKRYSFIIREEHSNLFGFDNILKEKFPEANIIILNKDTKGAVETCLKAKPYIKDNEGVIVLDCDLNFKSDDYYSKVEKSLCNQQYTDGVLLTFKSDNPRYSYVSYDGDVALKTAEKEVISDRAITGSYYFNKGSEFINIAEQLLQNNQILQKSEYYVSYLFNILIDNGKNVRIAKINDFKSFGTPEELKSL